MGNASQKLQNWLNLPYGMGVSMSNEDMSEALKPILDVLKLRVKCALYIILHWINCRCVDEVIVKVLEQICSQELESVGVVKSSSRLLVFHVALPGSVADRSLYNFESCVLESDIVISFLCMEGWWSLLKVILVFVSNVFLICMYSWNWSSPELHFWLRSSKLNVPWSKKKLTKMGDSLFLFFFFPLPDLWFYWSFDHQEVRIMTRLGCVYSVSYRSLSLNLSSPRLSESDIFITVFFFLMV